MKVVLYVTQTANGYIANETDEMPWSASSWSNHYKTIKGFKAQVLGRRTYQIMKRKELFRKMGNPFTVVVSSFPAPETEGNIAYAKSPYDALQILKEKGFKNIVVHGGGKMNASFMLVKLVDEVWLDVEPFVFGTGIKLFHDSFFSSKLKLISTKRLSQNTVQLRYKVMK
ncbi:MAG TPA: dihydrofolate reductase family protein [Candidatus Acidoferrum sp.]|nr:dihydrofolate reductase family protein [Candidatus Acidoferrum sp.]